MRNGLLFPYNTSLSIYHCPADHSTITTLAGVNLSQLRWRSYNMSLCINGAPDLDPDGWSNPSFKKFTEIRDPNPSQLFVFLDVHEDEIFDCTFGMPSLQYWGDAQVWWDIPANRHTQGATFPLGTATPNAGNGACPKSIGEVSPGGTGRRVAGLSPHAERLSPALVT